MVFGFSKRSKNNSSANWYRDLGADGISVSKDTRGVVLASESVPGFLAQLEDDGLLVQGDENSALLSWAAFFEALQLPGYSDLAEAFSLPPFTQDSFELFSSGSLIDPSFSIAIGKWGSAGERREQPALIGAMLVRGEQRELMRPDQWNLYKAVAAFSRREQTDRNDLYQRQAWGRIRNLAVKAGARLDSFLYRSVVLTPDRLDIQLRRSESVSNDKVIEVTPSFVGAPQNWINKFDATPTVLDRYDLSTEDGIVQILITPQIKTVLQEIKRLPARRVAGSRAQAFTINPYATLGPDATEVINEQQFESARDSAGLHYERFLPTVDRDSNGYPLRVGLIIESAISTGPVSSKTQWLTDSELSDFIAKLESSIRNNFPLLGWGGYDLELQGDASDSLNILEEALEQRRIPPAMVSYAQVHDLSLYSSRIEGIGTEKPYYSPYIAKKRDDEGWFPENITPVVSYTPPGETEPVAVPVDKTSLDKLRKAIDDATTNGSAEISLPWLPTPMPISEARQIVRTFDEVTGDIAVGTFKPSDGPTTGANKPAPRKTLILRANIEALDYEERRRDALLALPVEPEVPNGLRGNVQLLPHQRQGLAWLQHLFTLKAEYQVRGAVLADDMGLGKTFQLLAFMAWIVEKNPAAAPMLVVAPVSLLENWKEECSKFIEDGQIPILTAYGSSLNSLRVPREAIDERLKAEDGLVRFLKPGWVGGAKIVLTTYETLRDLEFSFSAERWTVMVCDEAQRIKNPAAMVTRAAKKQNVDFKIACTGTPVENTLADLWCLFDFIQPGLLGALNDFGQRYRKPIEAKDNEEETAKIEELRARISPQILRRTKAEVAKDLPRKITDQICKNLAISNSQRSLYSKAIEDFKDRNKPDSVTPFKNHLGLLQYLRLLCTDPRRHGLTAFKPDPIEEYRARSPKLHWLLEQLERIQSRNEKVIIFCEFRSIQRLLQHYIEKTFHVSPDIINGDTSASANHVSSRQKRIKAFQEKRGFNAIILSPIAVGFGVNIQAANHVIHYTRTWNPAKEDQATDRAYRIGQTKDVYVYYPVITAPDFDTFDVKLDQLLEYKRELAKDMLNGSGDVNPGDFNIRDVAAPESTRGLDERITIEDALRMDWRYFEGLAAAIWAKKGFDICYCTPSANDQGVDVVAIKNHRGVLIQAKSSATEGIRLGWEAIKEVVAGEAYYRKVHPGVEFEKICLTNQFFNDQTIVQAGLNKVELIDQIGLAELLIKHPTSMLAVERLIYSSWAPGSRDDVIFD